MRRKPSKKRVIIVQEATIWSHDLLYTRDISNTLYAIRCDDKVKAGNMVTITRDGRAGTEGWPVWRVITPRRRTNDARI